VEELDVPRKLIYVKEVKGKMEISWPGDFGEIHTRILERMKRVLMEDTVYPYLKKNAQKRLDVARRVARNTGMLTTSLVHLGGYSWCLFPWLGTRSFRTLRKFIAHNGRPFKISSMEYEGCYYMTFKMEQGNGYGLIEHLNKIAQTEGVDLDRLVSPSECPVFEKYDDRIPSELLRKAYTADRLREDEVLRRLSDLMAEY
jgi:ATP-dependent Lhr-like helicase